LPGPQPDPDGPPGRRFLILGLPRSGTTYLMTLLNAHRAISCSGEQFNPHAIVGVGEKNIDAEAVLGRDVAPLWFMERFFEQAGATGAARVGFKFMIGHNIRVLSKLADYPDIALIHVWRENKLAQVSSLIKAAQSRKWAQSTRDEHLDSKIDATPRQISHRWHEYATFDYLFQPWFDSLPNRRITLEYRELFQPGFEARICDFLGLPGDPEMKSPLVKQSANAILDRFEDPEPIARYFRRIGRADWLEPEL
jgi:LPS sulfotransferase NodH